jgi:DNA invertase Pin-like site-specific DNA recombinase
MIVGYCRTSTVEQLAGFEAQERDLKAAGATKLYKEQTSSVGPRKELAAALDFVRDGDVLMVTKLDRLARSVRHLNEIVDQLATKGVTLRILSMGLDTATSTGKLMLNVLGSVAQFEREVMLERQLEGIAKAKGEGRYKGRKATAKAKSSQVLELAGKGLQRDQIAKELGIGVASVYRALAAAKAESRA